MSRERGRDDVRSMIAVHAARLMAQDGIEDYGLAKRKAAKQLGIPDTRKLPANEEIDVALREYQGIYRGGEQSRQVRVLREYATRIMRELEAFAPHLTGPVLTGTAGPYAGIRLQLFTDNAKQVEHFLLDRAINYRAAQARYFAGNEQAGFPVFTMEYEGVTVELTVFDTGDLRAPIRSTPEGRAIERAKLAAVEALLKES